jgi:hypothetical protein
MIQVSESSDLDAYKIQRILEKNNIEVYINHKYLLNTTPSITSAGGNCSTVLKVKESDFPKAKKLLKKYHKKERLNKTNIPRYLEQVKHLDQLIRNKNTGPLNILSKKIDVSQRQICTQLHFLKCLNAKIKFNKESNSYCYMEPFELLFQFSLLSITKEEIVEFYCSSEEKNKTVIKKKSEYIE